MSVDLYTIFKVHNIINTSYVRIELFNRVSGSSQDSNYDKLLNVVKGKSGLILKETKTASSIFFLNNLTNVNFYEN